MSPGGSRPAPPPGRLALWLGGALLAAGAVTILFVMPAEYGRDPTGFGRLTGLDALYTPPERVIETRLSAPPEVLSEGAGTVSHDIVHLTIGGMTEFRGEIEYKVTVAAGDVLIYRLRSSAPIYFEFHGHSLGGIVELMQYQSAETDTAEGILIAPMDGYHGWYFRNGGFTPIEVEIELMGQYTLDPGAMRL